MYKTTKAEAVNNGLCLDTSTTTKNHVEDLIARARRIKRLEKLANASGVDVAVARAQELADDADRIERESRFIGAGLTKLDRLVEKYTKL